MRRPLFEASEMLVYLGIVLGMAAIGIGVAYIVDRMQKAGPCFDTIQLVDDPNDADCAPGRIKVVETPRVYCVCAHDAG